jgi:hypothetical protein
MLGIGFIQFYKKQTAFNEFRFVFESVKNSMVSSGMINASGTYIESWAPRRAA